MLKVIFGGCCCFLFLSCNGQKESAEFIKNENVHIYNDNNDTTILVFGKKKYGIEKVSMLPIWDENNNVDTIRVINYLANEVESKVIVFAIEDPDLGNRSNILSYQVTGDTLIPIFFNNGVDSFDELVSFGYFNLIDSKGNVFVYSANMLKGNKSLSKIDKYTFNQAKKCFEFSKSKLFLELPKDRSKVLF